MNRRQWLIGGVGSALAGTIWAAGFAKASRVSGPVIDVIGNGDSQLVLIDTERHRLLILSGPPNDRLVDAVSRLLGPFRPRIDAAFATGETLRDTKDSVESQRTVGEWFQLPDGTTAASPRARTLGAVPVRFGLSHEVFCDIHQVLAGSDPQAATWRIDIQRGPARISVAATLETIVASTSHRVDLAIAPIGTLHLAARRGTAGAYALNTERVEPDLPASITMVRIFPRDRARIDLEPERLRLPAWTETGDVVT